MPSSVEARKLAVYEAMRAARERWLLTRDEGRMQTGSLRLYFHLMCLWKSVNRQDQWGLQV